MNYRVDHIPKLPDRRPGRAMRPQYLTIHSTGNPSSTAKNERAWLTNPANKRTASWHIVVDEKEAIEAIPLNELAFHSGTAAGNSTSIALEICESGNRQQTIANAIKVIASILKRYGWGIDKLKRHYDWSGKNCPRILSANNWAEWHKFVEEVRKELEGVNTPSSWAKEAQKWVVDNGISDGKDPKKPITREEVWTMLHRLKTKGVIK